METVFPKIGAFLLACPPHVREFSDTHGVGNPPCSEKWAMASIPINTFPSPHHCSPRKQDVGMWSQLKLETENPAIICPKCLELFWWPSKPGQRSKGCGLYQSQWLPVPPSFRHVLNPRQPRIMYVSSIFGRRDSLKRLVCIPHSRFFFSVSLHPHQCLWAKESVTGHALGCPSLDRDYSGFLILGILVAEEVQNFLPCGFPCRRPPSPSAPRLKNFKLP